MEIFACSEGLDRPTSTINDRVIKNEWVNQSVATGFVVSFYAGRLCDRSVWNKGVAGNPATAAAELLYCCGVRAGLRLAGKQKSCFVAGPFVGDRRNAGGNAGCLLDSDDLAGRFYFAAGSLCLTASAANETIT